MSDIQELIHKTSMDCIEKGQAMERERIIKLLEDKDEELIGYISSWFDYGLDLEAGRANRNRAIKLIKGETNG